MGPRNLNAGETLRSSRQQRLREEVFLGSVKARLRESVEVTGAIQSGIGVKAITSPFQGTRRDSCERGQAGVCHWAN